MIKIGICGIFRGVEFYKNAKNCKVVAICEKRPELIERVKKEYGMNDVTFFLDYDEFLKFDMDGVVLANYANEHAPFAIKAMKAGKHVLSEVLPCQTLKEAVELIETVESTGKIYSYAENYCFFDSTRKMKELFDNGTIGDFEYGEGEYVHNCEPIWPDITYGEKDHWRNNMYATFYCTHSLGPLIHISGLRPVSVVGFEFPFNDRNARMGLISGAAGMEIVTLENGAILKSIHGGLVKNSIWYTIYGSKGRLESAREDANPKNVSKIYKNADSKDGVWDGTPEEIMVVSDSKGIGHGGSDYYAINNFVDKIAGKNAEIIDVYEALDMFLPGLMAYKSVLNGNIPMSIPNLRDPKERDKYRNDTMCTDKKVAGDMYVYPYSKGEILIPDEIYENVKNKWLDNIKEKEKKNGK